MWTTSLRKVFNISSMRNYCPVRHVGSNYVSAVACEDLVPMAFQDLSLTCQWPVGTCERPISGLAAARQVIQWPFTGLINDLPVLTWTCECPVNGLSRTVSDPRDPSHGFIPGVSGKCQNRDVLDNPIVTLRAPAAPHTCMPIPPPPIGWADPRWPRSVKDGDCHYDNNSLVLFCICPCSCMPLVSSG
jgi:hypothetical protein